MQRLFTDFQCMCLTGCWSRLDLFHLNEYKCLYVFTIYTTIIKTKLIKLIYKGTFTLLL